MLGTLSYASFLLTLILPQVGPKNLYLTRYSRPILFPTFYSYVGTLGQRKLIDDLSPLQFESLVKVLSLLSLERGFNFLTSANLQSVFDQLEEFFVPTIPRFNFEGLGGARARERVLHRLLIDIEEVTEARETEAMAIGDDFPIPSLPQREPQGPHKWPWESSEGLGDCQHVPPIRRTDPRNRLRGGHQAPIRPNEASL